MLFYSLPIDVAHHEIKKLVRKEFRPSGEQTIGDYKRELMNLSILKTLKHPNIIELLGSYTYREMHNLIFPAIHGGDLARLLSETDRRSEFQMDQKFFIALSELSSAIKQLHYATMEGLDLKLIGCHHDLKPGNILVSNSTFILADFGLSRFKDEAEPSKTPFQEGRGEYLAPECEDLSGDFTKHSVQRSSDIWSFGCVIVEVLTYLLLGAERLTQFKENRAFKLGHFKFYRFHKGPNTPNEAVTEMLSCLNDHASNCGKVVLQVAQRMLSVEPEARPKIDHVTFRLQIAALLAIMEKTEEMYTNWSPRSESIEFDVESKRHQSWKLAFESIAGEDGHALLTLKPAPDFRLMIQCLLEIQEELQSLQPHSLQARHHATQSLRLLGSRLNSLLPQKVMQMASSHFESLLIDTDNLKILEERGDALSRFPFDRRIGMLAAIKRMTLLVNSNAETPTNLLIKDPQFMRYTRNLDYNDMYVRKDHEGASENIVLVEWITYAEHWSNESIGNELFNRVNAIATLLSLSKPANGLRTLPCQGYYHDPARLGFGLVFDLPHELTTDSLRIATLRQAFDDPSKPLLGDRFRLAHGLAIALLDFHKVGWLHKSFSSLNVIFLAPTETALAGCISDFYIKGFTRSRVDDLNAFTEGPSGEKDYQHPEYLKDSSRFRREFDYYSLGLVLLEIGYWMPLEKLTKDWVCSPEGFRELLVKRRVPQLGRSMGARYRDAVKVCLEGNFEGVQGESHTSMLHLIFTNQVIEKLASCSA
jgi:serine/threonine protein kinase